MTYTHAAEKVIPTANYNNVVPLPQSITLKKGKPFILSWANDVTVIHYDGKPADSIETAMQRNSEFLVEYTKEFIGHNITKPISKDETGRHIALVIDKSVVGDEAYKITVSEKRITIAGSTPNGVFYGIQTLRKSLPIVPNTTGIALPAAEITDTPRFAYRGMMLDCARHFFSLDMVKEYIDLLALHGMNTFHWHLSDDQGWRIEIKKYPRLTDYASTRRRTVVGRNSPVYDNTPYGGFYTQEQAREIVRYAAERYITVIPEIDMPGHMLAALAAFPELGCTGGPYEVCPNWGVFDDILCAGNERTYTFIDSILDELMDIFPSKYIHLGGDEAPKTRWKECPKCQALIQEESIVGDEKTSAEDKLQGFFITQIEKYLNSKGRKMIGWDEVLDAGVSKSATIMSWRGTDGGLRAAEMGHDVIMTPTTYAYLDYYQTKETYNEPLLIGGYLPISKVYSFEPAPDSLSAAARQHILGVQANLWSEYLTCYELVEYQVLPRMAAIAEIQWVQPEKKDFNAFKQRLNSIIALYKSYGLNVGKVE